MKYEVSPDEHGLSLQAFLKKKGGETFLSLKKIKKLIESKGCRVGGKIEVFSSRRLMENEIVEVQSFFLEEEVSSAEIIFEDEYFAAINKPVGVVCLEGEFQKILPKKAREWKLVHRLDKETSGVLLLAKTPWAEAAARNLFSTRAVQKLYLALVRGKVSKKQGVIDNFLGSKGGYQGQTIYGSVSQEEGQRAITCWSLIGKGGDGSLLLCDLKTGRTHQIRAHLSELGYPILGDHQYGKKGEDPLYSVKRHLLHSWKLIFIHPKTQKEITLMAAIPADFRQALKDLKIPLEEDQSQCIDQQHR